MTTALAGVRVLDLSGEAGQYCGKLLGDFGAEVLHIEPPARDDVRRLGPFYEDLETLDRSLYWHALNTSKRAITLQLASPQGQAIFWRLLATADIVLESFAPGTLAAWGYDFATLQQRFPHLVLTSITPFGQSGPYRELRATELEVFALGGFLAGCGDPDRPPVRISAPQANLFASINAYTGTLMAYYHRLRTGQGQWVDVSMQEGATNLHHAQLLWNTYGLVPQRMGSRLMFSPGVYIPVSFACQDGYVQAIPLLSWHTFIPWMVEHDLAGDLLSAEWQARLQTLAMDWTQEQVDHAHAVVGNFLRHFPKRELYARAMRDRQLLYPVQNVRDCLDDPQLQARDYFVNLESPALGLPLTYPGAPFRMSATPWRISRPAPSLGEHNTEIYEGLLGMSPAELVALRQQGVI